MAWPKGKPRPAGAGRKKGEPNKSTAEIKALAHQYCPQAVQTLVSIMTSSESEANRIAAAKELMDRGIGKSVQTVEHSGPEGGDIRMRVSGRLNIEGLRDAIKRSAE